MDELLILKNRLKEARVEKGLSQAQLAELVGVSRNTISSIETGQFSPTAKLALITSSVENGDFEEDMSQVLSNLNDNHFYGFKSSPTGEDFRLNPAGYREVRQKKSYQARHLLNDLRKQAEEQRAIEQANAEAFKKFKAREAAREENNNVKK